MPECIIPKCSNIQNPNDWARGLCMRCYGIAKKRVEAGVVTWEELVGLGLALPKESEGESDPFSVELKKKLEGG